MAIGLKLVSIEKMDHLDTLTTLTMWFGIILDNVLHVCFPARWWRSIRHAYELVHTLISVKVLIYAVS